MSATSPALLAAAAGVGFGHAILPDHWAPLAVLGRTRGYPLSRVARLAGLAAVAHVLVSIVLGAIIVAVGLQLRSSVQSAQDTIVGALLVATGLGFALLELSGHGHHRHGDHEHEHTGDNRQTHGHGHGHGHGDDRGLRRGLPGVAAVMVPFGAAASPDLTILPVFLAATAAGAGTAIGSLVTFAAATIATIVGLTLLACFGGYQLQGEWLQRWGNAFTALVLVVIGALVLTHVL